MGFVLTSKKWTNLSSFHTLTWANLWFKTWKQDAIWVFLCFSSPSMPIRTYGKTFINWSLRLKCKQLLIFLVDVVILRINCAFRPTTKGIHQSLIPNTMLVQPIELRWKKCVTPFYLVTHFVLDLWNLTIDFAHGSFVAQMSRKVLLTSYFFLYKFLLLGTREGANQPKLTCI